MCLKNRIILKAEHQISTTSILKADLHAWSKKLVCIIGPSGVGKHSLCHALIKADPSKFHLFGPTTTRFCSSDDININNCIPTSYEEFQKKKFKNDFLYYHETSHGSFGVKKTVIKKLSSYNSFILFPFRSLGGVAFKLIMPSIKVIELRASPEVILDRLNKRRRDVLNNINLTHQIHTELEQNAVMCEYFSHSYSNWYTIINKENDPPISNKVVESVYNLIIAET